ncbi:PIG-L deacetylase family protein [Blastococcus deserti]|uniref:PIG-L deacetylase family protein n=1 Tax=Blastococcus deserti TaxID=2259033 RepID=A0ABW4X6F4_9ACTN
MPTATALLPSPAGRSSGAVPTLLGVWAHPDDEAYLSAGLLATAVDAGWRVVIATATRGEIGTDDPDGCPPEVLSRARTRELVDSLAVLGVQEHRWLRASRPLVDGRLADVPEEAGIRAVADVLTDVGPDLVVTFGPDGLTGHSDHRTVSRWVTRARNRVGNRAALWYAALTPEFLHRWGDVCTEQEVWMDGGPPEPVDPADLVHVQTCSGPLLDRKYASLRAHTSQTAGLIARVGEQRYRQWWSTEAFVAAPPPDDAVAAAAAA